MMPTFPPDGKNIRWYAVGYRRSVVDLDTRNVIRNYSLYTGRSRESLFFLLLCGLDKCIDDDCRWAIDTPPPHLASSRQTERRIPVLVYRRQTRYTTRINIRTEVSTVPLSSKRQSQGYDFFSLKVGWILENPVCFFCIVGGRIEIQAIGYLWN